MEVRKIDNGIMINYIEEIQVRSNEINYMVSTFLSTINNNISNINKNLANIENQYVNPTEGETLLLNLEGKPILGNLIDAIKALSSAIAVLIAIGGIKSIVKLANAVFKGRNLKNLFSDEEGTNDGKNITVNCECHCDCCCGGDGDPEGEKVPSVETTDAKVAILDQYGNEIKNLDSSVVETSGDVIALNNNFTTATKEMNSTASAVFPKISSVMNHSLLASLVLIGAQSLKTEKITNGAFDGIANATKLSNGSLLADATSTYGKWLTDIKTFFEKRLGLYSKNEKAINGTVSKEGKALNKLNQENLLKYNGTTSIELAKDIALYNKLGVAIKKIVLENGKKINAAHETALKGYSKTTSTELAVDYAVYKKIGSEILKLLGTNGKTANANNKSALGQLNKQTAEALNQEIALYKKIENQLNQMQKKSSKTVNTTHNEGLLSYLGDTKAHLEQEMQQWDTHGKHVIGTNKRIITSITGIHASGLLKYVGELLNPLATIERLWNTHGQRVTASNKNTMNSVNSNTFTGLNTLEGTVQDSGQKIEGSVSTTGNNSARKIAGTVGNINQSFQGAGATWGQSLKGSLNYLEGVVDSWGPKILSAFKYVWKPVQDFLGSVAKVTAPLLPVEEGVSEAFAVEPTKSTWDISRLRGANFNGNEFALDRSGDVNVVINSPKALNPFEVRRQMEKMSRNMANGFY